MKHWKEYRCHNDYGRPHTVEERGRRIPMEVSDLSVFCGNEDNYPDKPVNDYVVAIWCIRCGRGAKVNKDGFVLERLDRF